MDKKKCKVLMLGPSRKDKGGITTVVNNYFDANLHKEIYLKYITTTINKSSFHKLLYFFLGLCNYMLCCLLCYQVVHIHMSSRASFYRKSIFVRLGFLMRKKVIIHIHGSEFKEFYINEMSDKRKAYLKNTLLKASKIIVLSNSWKKFIIDIINEDKVIVLHNSIRLNSIPVKNVKDKNILFLGRIGDRKGIFDLIRIMPEIVAAYPDVKLFIGGDGEIERLNRAIEELKLTDNVNYIGWIENEAKNNYLLNASVFILPSYNEGLPMSILEAMSYSIPVITTNIGGIPDIIQDGFNGCLLNPGDLNRLKELILYMLSNESKRLEIGNNGYTTVSENFNIDKAITQLNDIYNKL